jgi:hypothetical protein
MREAYLKNLQSWTRAKIAMISQERLYLACISRKFDDLVMESSLNYETTDPLFMVKVVEKWMDHKYSRVPVTYLLIILKGGIKYLTRAYVLRIRYNFFKTQFWKKATLLLELIRGVQNALPTTTQNENFYFGDRSVVVTICRSSYVQI